MSQRSLQIKPMGERAILVNFEPFIEEVVLEKVLSLKEKVLASHPEASLEIITAYHSLLIVYASTIEDVYGEISRLERLSREPKIGKKMKSQVWELPVCYHPDLGPDLEWLSRQKHLSVEEVIRLHSQKNYTVYFIGFLPGFLYLGGLDEKHRVPRREQPRLDVKKGSVGIGENQTGIYPQNSPGGWQIIGNCPLTLFDSRRDPPIGIMAGDRVRFLPVSREEFEDLKEEAEAEPSRFGEASTIGIEVLHPGLYSSVQDMGRRGSLQYGVPQSGVMDQYAYRVANMLLQNPSEAAVLEITQLGPKLRFGCSLEIAITGAELSPLLNGVPMRNNRVYGVEVGDLLSFGKRRSGCRAYLAVAGGFKTQEVLHSRSWYPGITPFPRLETGMVLSVESSEKEGHGTHSGVRKENGYLSEREVDVFPGPEFHLLSQREQEDLLDREFRIGRNNNRMAIQLEELLQNQLGPIITGPVLPGTVQLTPGGSLIVLMRDCQTTGGYPRVLQISDKGMDVLAQKVLGDHVKFRLRH